MKDERPYIEHKGKVIEKNAKFKYVMAITLDPVSKYTRGLLRCITSRSGDLAFAGNVDRSELHKITGSSLENFEIEEKLDIKNESEIISELCGEDGDFIGLEDPDIWIDKDKNLMHLYFTIPIKFFDKKHDRKITKVHLGHAVGEGLDSLEMTMPIVLDLHNIGAKEVSIAPLNKNNTRHNLVESNDHRHYTAYSVIQVVTASDMGLPWERGEIVFHPADSKFSWIAGHASPGPLLSKNFIDVGENKLLGIINGCEADQKIGKKTKHGDFSIGLFIYDYEKGKIDWVSPEPFIQDSEAGKGGLRAITFASQVVETGVGEAILYAHVDDSFVRAYTLNAEKLKKLLP